MHHAGVILVYCSRVTVLDKCTPVSTRVDFSPSFAMDSKTEGWAQPTPFWTFCAGLFPSKSDDSRVNPGHNLGLIKQPTSSARRSVFLFSKGYTRLDHWTRANGISISTALPLPTSPILPLCRGKIQSATRARARRARSEGQ